MSTTRSLGSTLDRMMTLNRAMDHALVGGWLNEARAWIPALDLVERKDAYLLYVELPGVRESDMELVFEQNILTIRGAKRTALDSTDVGELRVFTAERTSGAFERSIRLPDSIDRDNVVAQFAGGLLTITLPKAKTAQPRRIEINSPQRAINEATMASAEN
jgi:HSP20 family protein